MQRQHLFLPRALLDRLRSAARARGVTVGEIARAALFDHLDRIDREAAQAAGSTHNAA
jgi:hypothetical protein